MVNTFVYFVPSGSNNIGIPLAGTSEVKSSVVVYSGRLWVDEFYAGNLACQ